MYERDLKAHTIEYETYLRPIEHAGRFICEVVKGGFVKIHVMAGSGTIVGATIVAPNAGDMISEITTCVQYTIGLAIGAGQLAGVQHPYVARAVRLRCDKGLVARAGKSISHGWLAARTMHPHGALYAWRA